MWGEKAFKLLNNRLILFLVLLVALSTSLAIVSSQTSDSDLTAVVSYQEPTLVSLSSNEIKFAGSLNAELAPRTFTVYGLSEIPVSVLIDTNELYENNTGVIVSEDKLSVNPPSFNISNAEAQNVTVTFDATDVGAGTYSGAIVVIATNGNGTTTSSTIYIIVGITGPSESFFSSFQNYLVWAILGLSFLGYVYKEKWRLKQYLVIGISILVTYIWIYMIFALGFDDLNSTIATIIIAPYLTYAATYLTEKRSQRTEREKTSIAVRNEGIKEDINLMRCILGELTTHFASFTPNYYDKEKPTVSAKLLFSKGNGELSRKIWDDSTKQGMVANITILEIEKYYEFIDLYNRYYSCARTITENMSEKTFEEVAETTFFVKFGEFRKKYAELENVLFVNLSYYLGLFNKTNLSPINVDYPRVTRTLLKKLVDYEVLAPDEYPKKSRVARFLLRLKLRSNEESKEEKEFRAKFETKYQKQFPETKLSEEYQEECPGKQASGEEYEKWKGNKKLKEEVKLRINEFKLTASELQKIIDEIYSKDSIPLFYFKVEEDYHKAYLALKASIKELVTAAPLPTIFVEKEAVSDFSKDNTTRTAFITEMKSLSDKTISIGDPEKLIAKILEKYKILANNEKTLKDKIKNLTDELIELEAMHDANLLTDEEFESAKDKLMKYIFDF